jgi:limonene-1,2-epoxide hydrolase
VRVPAALALAAATVLTGCGHHAAPTPRQVVYARSAAINSGNDKAAAALFATDSEVVQGTLALVLHSPADALRFNRALPCAGKIVAVTVDGAEVTATFELGERPGHTCDGPGAQATAIVKVEHGKITLWHQVEPGESAGSGPIA